MISDRMPLLTWKLTTEKVSPDGAYCFITLILKTLVSLAIWLALIGTIYSRVPPSLALNRIYLTANEKALHTKTDQIFRFLKSNLKIQYK